MLHRAARIALALWLSWSILGPSQAAQPEDVPEVQPAPPAQPAQPAQTEQENQPPASPLPNKKHSRRRPAVVRREWNDPGVRVEVGQDVTIGAGETVPGVVVIGGKVTVEGTVQGAVVVISGSARINGQVDQDVVAVVSPLSLGSKAHVGHNVVAVGGTFKANPEAVIDGRQTIVPLPRGLPNLLWLQNWVIKGLFLARPFPPRVPWVWLVAGVFFLIYVALALMFPRPVRACVGALENQPLASFFSGIALFVVLGPL